MNIELNYKKDDSWEQKFNQQLEAGLTAGCIILESEAKKITPRKYGKLFNAYGRDVKNNIGVVYNTAEYAPYLEFSEPPKHPKLAGKKIPFMRPALYDNIDKIKQAITNELLKAFK